MNKSMVLICIFALLLMKNVQAAPVRDMPYTIVQPDGTVVECLASGDEFFNYLHDKQGNIIRQDYKTGYYFYVIYNGTDLELSSYKAGSQLSKSEVLQAGIINQKNIKSINRYKGYIDAPTSKATLSGIAEVSGWYISIGVGGISKVEILVDGVVQGEATRYPRAVLEDIFPMYSVGDAGYTYSIDTTNISNGTHILTVKATGRSGLTNQLDRSIIVSNTQNVLTSK